MPASPWLDKKAPEPPQVTTVTVDDSLKVNWTHLRSSDVFHYVVYYQYAGGKWNYTIFNRDDRTTSLSLVVNKNKLTGVAVTAVDRTGNESKLVNGQW